MSPEPKPLHHDIALNVFERLKATVGRAFKVGMRMNMKMEALHSAPSPDVWVVDQETWRAAREANAYPENAPILAVEVISPSNRRRRVREKVDLYLAAGGAAVWVIYPKRKEMREYLAGREEATYGAQEIIFLPSPLQGSVAVDDIFRLE